MRVHLKNLQTALREVFAHPSYIALANTLALLAFLFAVWLPNLGLMNTILTTSSAPLAAKAKLAWSLLGGIRTNFSVLSAGYTLAIATLFGLNGAMIVYLLKRSRVRLTRQETGVAFGGVASGALGIGCAFCGSFILSTIFASLGAAGAIALLPLRGGEFGIVSVALLLVSLVFISRKIAAPLTCNAKSLWTTN